MKMTKPLSWTPEQEAAISQLMAAEGLTRIKAIHRMRAGRVTVMAEPLTAAMASEKQIHKSARKPKAEKTAKAPKKPAVEPAFTPRMAQDGTYRPGKAMQETIDTAIIAVARKKFGKVIPVLGTLGLRYHAPYEGGQPYQRYLLDNGHTVFVSLAGGVVTVSDKPAVKTSYTVARFLATQSRKQQLQAKKLLKEAK
jgi:hypothetical protein